MAKGKKPTRQATKKAVAKKAKKVKKKATKKKYPADHTVGEFRSSTKVSTALVDGVSFRGKALQYAEVDGIAIFEGDIELGSVEEVQAAADRLRTIAADPTSVVAQGVVISGAQFRWPNCRVPYEIDPALPNQARVTDAIDHWETNTNYRFIERTPANAAQFPDYVTFTPGSGCSSAVGRRGGQQFIRLAAGCSTGNTIHEIGHAIGLWHEQSREDRDAFVTINFANIIPGFEHNFDQHIADGDDVGAYDYGSIMHYPRDAFSSNGQDTITPTQPGVTIGQRTALSAGDIAAANSICTTPPKLKFTDEQPTLKFRDERPTLKFRDEQPTLKFLDERPTLKFLDDRPTLKFLDDRPTLKFLDERPTLKFLDDGGPQPTLKFRDERPEQTLKFNDDPQPTLKFRDEEPTLKFNDDPQPTLKFRDEEPTLKFNDDPQPTLKFADEEPTLKFRDEGPGPTLKFGDDGPQPTLKGADDGITGPGPGPRPQAGAPFVLATPHHSTAWAESYPDAYLQELEEQLNELHEYLSQVSAAAESGQIGAEDQQQADSAYQQFVELLEEYLRRTGGAG